MTLAEAYALARQQMGALDSIWLQATDAAIKQRICFGVQDLFTRAEGLQIRALICGAGTGDGNGEGGGATQNVWDQFMSWLKAPEGSTKRLVKGVPNWIWLAGLGGIWFTKQQKR